MNLKIVALSGKSQTKMNTCCLIYRKLQNMQSNLIYSDRKHIRGITWDEREGLQRGSGKSWGMIGIFTVMNG